MQSHDIICRAVICPRAIKNDVFDDEQFLNFTALNPRKTVYASSVVSYYLIRTRCAVHRYGEGVAAKGNARLMDQKGCVPIEEERVYLGFYWLKYCDVLSVDMRFYSLKVRWKREEDCEAHFQIEMQQCELSGTRGERKRDRIAAINRIGVLLYGPCVPNPVSNKAKPFMQKLPQRRVCTGKGL